MKTLQAYISLIEPRFLRHITGSTKRFLQLFMSQKYASEEAFMRAVCGEKHNERHYKHQKNKAIKILQAFAIISRSTGVSSSLKKYDFCRKNFMIGYKFLERGSRKAGLDLIRLAHRTATEYDIVHIACETSSLLYHNFVYYQPHGGKAAHYASLVERYLEDYTAEKKAEHYFYQAIAQIGRSKKSIDFNQSLKKINECKGQSVKYKVYQSMIEVFYGFSINDYHLIIKSCRQTLDMFSTRKGVYVSHRLFFMLNMGKAQMAIGNYNAANQSFIASEKHVPTSSLNYAIIQLQKTLNTLHSGDYQTAHELYKHNRKCRFENIKEQFAIIEAYLCFLSHMGYLELKYPFRLGKYLNETFKAQTDKEGSNIAILIAELLVYLGRDRGKFIDRIEAVQNYTYRHLKSQDTRRAKRFIKILCMLPKVNFHPVALERNAARHIQYLKDHPVSMGENVSIEILPFDVILKMILEKLQKRGVA